MKYLKIMVLVLVGIILCPVNVYASKVCQYKIARIDKYDHRVHYNSVAGTLVIDDSSVDKANQRRFIITEINYVDKTNKEKVQNWDDIKYEYINTGKCPTYAYIVTKDTNKKVWLFYSKYAADKMLTDQGMNDVMITLGDETYFYNEEKAHIAPLITNSEATEEDIKKLDLNLGDDIDENCNGILGEDFLSFLSNIFKWVKIVVPILVIILGSVDFASSLLQDEMDSMKKATNKFVKRLLIAVAIFLLTFILTFVLNIFNEITGAGTSVCEVGKINLIK